MIPLYCQPVDPPGQPDDATLAHLAKGGSTSAFGELVRRYHARVFSFLLTLSRHRQDAEDLTQETFLRAWDKIHHYNPALPLLPWLFTLARRQSIAALRRARPLPAEAFVFSAPEPSNQSLRLWETAKALLPPAAFSALWLHYREELPLKEVASILGKREGAVKVMLHRARKTLSESFHPAVPRTQPPPLPHPSTVPGQVPQS